MDYKKVKIKFQKNTKGIVIFYGKKLVGMIKENELKDFLNNENLDIQEFEQQY